MTTRTLHYAFTVIIGELIWFGTPAPSSLDDGHLTLGKQLTTPRVSGHAAGAETPRAESLIVHFDTTVDSVASGTNVMDSTDNRINGTLTNGAAYSSSDRALTFDGTNDYVVGTLNNPAGDWVHSFSFWMKLNVDQSTIGMSRVDPVQMGSTASGSKYSAIDVHGTTINWYFYSNDVSFPISGIKAGEWNHLTFAYQGGGTNKYRHAYLNGTEVTMTTSLSGGSALNIDANASFALGSDFVRPGAYLNGSISNFKVWNVALTADEAAAEYALGRTAKALNITDTAVCLGGTAPRAQLDVRGTARFENITGGFPTYSRTTFSGVTSTTIPLDPDRFSVHKIFVRGKMTSPTGDSTRRCRIRPKTEGNTAFMSNSMESWSHAHRRSSATTMRAVYDGTDGPLMFGSEWNTTEPWSGTEVNCTFSAEITVYNRFGDGHRSQFVFDCAHTVPYTGMEIVRGACQPIGSTDQLKNIIELSLVFSSSGGTGSAAASGECIICGLN